MNRTLRTTLHVARTDWAPYIEAAVRAIATAAAFVYTAGYMTGRWLHNLNDLLVVYLVRTSPKGSAVPAWAMKVAAAKAAPAPVLYRCAAVPARCGIKAPRVHPAVTLAASGLSQRAIAAKLGCTRYEVRKALNAA